MPDLGLLHCGPPRRDPPLPVLVPPAADEPAPRALARSMASEVAILRESAPVESAIVVATAATITTAAAVPVVSASAGTSPAPAARESPPPATPRPPPMSATPPAAPIAWSDLLWLALAFAAIIGTGFGIREPWPADEPRFAAVARDMVASGEWLFPRVGGDLYQDKPPVFFWLLAAFYSLTGSIKTSFLIPSLLAAAGVTFLVYDFGRRLVSRAAGVAAGVLVLCTLQFVQTMRGAQIDPTLCFLTTFSLYSLLRHLLLGPSWRWFWFGGLIAGIGVITKGVGFLPMLVLVPYALMRYAGWKGLAPVDGGAGGWRWWIAPLAMLVGISLWFVPMLLAVANSGAPEYVQYRDEILFKQTVGRYASAWHHVKGWYYFLLEVIPALWLPWSVLLIWLVPRFRDAWKSRDARVWLPLAWVLILLAFFTASPGKRGVYILPALPALAFASLPFLETVLARRAVRLTSLVVGGLFWLAGVVFTVALWRGMKAPIPQVTPAFVLAFVIMAGLFVGLAAWRKPVAAFPAAIAALAVWFSYWLAPVMDGERSGADFTRQMQAQVTADEELALVAYKEQFLLYLDRPTFNFGHRRSFEGAQEAYDASAWVNAAPRRVLLVPENDMKPCFPADSPKAGESSDEAWYFVRSADADCARQGSASRAIRYPAH